jgi:hypothetical protein
MKSFLISEYSCPGCMQWQLARIRFFPGLVAKLINFLTQLEQYDFFVEH